LENEEEEERDAGNGWRCFQNVSNKLIPVEYCELFKVNIGIFILAYSLIQI
jgi:hypothetical protein